MFIEVTARKRKILIPVAGIEQVNQSKKGFAIIYVKVSQRSIFLPCENYIYCDETYEEVVAKIKKATGA